MRTISTLFVAFLLIGAHRGAAQAQEGSWGCYDPKPGHPTQAERIGFLNELRPVANEMQQRWGIPRVGILAMAAQESGFGWTRTALNAHNLFGWKYGPAAKIANLGHWTLECQPEWVMVKGKQYPDHGRVYASFRDGPGSMRFVAQQLANQARYQSTTALAGRAAATGTTEATLTQAWLRGLQRAGYNPNPHYPDDVLATARDAGMFDTWPNATVKPVAIAAFTPAVPVSAGALDRDAAEVLAWLKRHNAGRYMVAGAHCTALKSADWPGYTSLPEGTIQSCRYSVTSCAELKGQTAKLELCIAHRHVEGPKSATVVVLEPGLARFARWVASACATAGKSRAACLASVYKAGAGAGNWQIPIAGIVFEDMNKSFFVQVGYVFRDGLTVSADPQCGWINGAEAAPTPEQDAACSRPDATPKGVSNTARPMSTTLSELRAFKPDLASVPSHPERFPITGPAAPPWRDFVRSTLVAACSSDENPFVTAHAVALHHAGAF